MEDDTARMLLKKALLNAQRFGVKNKEDIAQEVVCGYLEKGDKKGKTVEHAVIDAIRKEYGDNRTASRSQKKAFNNPSGKLPNRSCELRNANGNEFHRLLGLVDKEERVILCLTYLWGFNAQEVGYCLDVSPSRISQIKKRAERRLRSKT